ncbi:MAG: sulfurtransferase [Microcystaceae cyanobacterium]
MNDELCINHYQSKIASREWLSGQLNNPQLIVIDCRFQLTNPDWGYQQYLASHIQGAYYLDLEKDLSSPVERYGGRHPLPNPLLLAQKLAAMGVNAGETLVVAYDNSRFAFAARLWWLLRYLGHENVALLDGGWTAWKAGGYPVTEIVPEPKPGRFVPQLHPDWIVDIEAVKAIQDESSIVLIDSRDAERYRGEKEPLDPVAGHIPGAVNSPWIQVSNEQGYLQNLAIQQQLWADYRQAKEIIVYCGSGVTACVNLLSLALAGIENVALYPGGWSDWCSYLRETSGNLPAD